MEDQCILWAVTNDDRDEVKKNLSTKDNVNRTLANGRTALHIAADCGHKELMEYLIDEGAEVNAVDKHGITPLISACGEGHIACVKLLLEKGADKNQKGPDGVLPVDYTDSKEIKALLK